MVITVVVIVMKCWYIIVAINCVIIFAIYEARPESKYRLAIKKSTSRQLEKQLLPLNSTYLELLFNIIAKLRHLSYLGNLKISCS